MNIITQIQDAFAKESAKKTGDGTSGLPPGDQGSNTQQPQIVNKDQQAQKGTDQNQGPNKDRKIETTVPPVNTNSNGHTDSKQLSKLLKEQYGIDLPEEEIVSKLKPKEDTTNQTQSTPNAVSVPAPVAPRIEDITDDEVGTLLESNGRSRDIIARAAELRQKDDISIVKQSYIDLLKKDHGVSDEDAEALFHERFFIPPEGKEDSYSESEIKIGKALLKQEADRLRGSVSNLVDGVKNLVFRNKQAEYDKVRHDAQVDAFIGGANRKMVVPIGKSGAKDLGEYPFNINDDVVKSVAETMKSPAKLVEKFKGDNGELDLQKMYDFLVYYEIKDNLLKSMANDYHSMGYDELKATLHNLPDLNNVSNNAERPKKTQADLKKDAEDYNRNQVDRNMSRNKRQ